MKKQLLKFSILSGILLLTTTHSIADYLVSTVTSGIVNEVNVGQSNLTINGQKYRYNLDVESSLFSIDEEVHVALSLRDVKVGQSYYFEKTSSKSDPQFNDYDGIIFISSKPLKSEEEL